MAGFWPLYSNFVSLSQVTLALPGVPSAISKSVGGNSPALLLVPNVDFLIAFIQGNIGIADSMTKSALTKNLNGPIASNDEMVARHFSKVNNLGLEDKMQQYKQGKKIKIPAADIALPTSADSVGFKAVEKAVLTSIFETQKPYMEIAKMVIDVMVSIEDIIARVMPLISASPLTAKSDKPVGNAGSGKRPKAIGYQGGKEIKAAIAALDKLSKIGGKTELDKQGNPVRDPSVAGTNIEEGAADESLLQNEKLKSMGKQWKIVDVTYSTGMYDPKVDYAYTYVDLPADENIDGKQADAPEDEEDPYEKYKPKRIILGIFDSKGVPLNPMDTLYTINDNFNLNNPEASYGKTKTNFPKADWVTRSPKWVFPKSTSPGATVWPTFGTPTFKWKGTGAAFGQTRESKTKPDAIKIGDAVVGDWEIRKYKKGEKNEINGFDAIEGDPVIAGFDAADTSAYTNYFTQYATVNMRLAKDLDEKEKAEATSMIMQQLNVKSHLENVNLYAQSKASVYKGFTVPEGMKLSFKPMQIKVDEAANDPKLAGLDGMIWIDPESDYETKIIEVKPATKIAYSEAKGDPSVQVDIKSFVKNKAIFRFSKGEKFNVDVKRNGQAFESFKGADQYILENWNYSAQTRTVSSGNYYSMNIWSENPAGKMADLFKANPRVVMGRKTDMRQHGDYEIAISYLNGAYDYQENEYLSSGTASGGTGTASRPKTFSDGLRKIGDGTMVEVKNKKVVKWYYVYDLKLDRDELPAFGKEVEYLFSMQSLREISGYAGSSNVKDRKEPSFAKNPKDIPLYQLKVSNADFPYGTIIDPSKILNEQLTKDELYSEGRYGAGSAEDPQELGTVYRYAKTDLDTETYYIIEGIRPEINFNSAGGNNGGSNANSNAGSSAGGGQYRLPHAIGAITVFIKMLVKIFSKLIPSIVKLLKLFKNPMGFVTDIIMEKLGESFSIFSPDALKKFEQAGDLIKKKKEFQKPAPPAVPGQPAPMAPNMGDYVRMMKGHFANSKLKNHVAVDSLGNFKDANGKIPKVPPKDAIGNFKFVADGVGFIPFTIFGKDLSFGMELKMGNVITKEWGNRMPMKLVFSKEKNSSGQDELKAGGVPSDGSASAADAKAGAQAKAETDKDKNANLPQGLNGSSDPNKRYSIVSTWYSTGEFIPGVDYKYIYIDQEDQGLLDEVDKLSNSIDPKDLEDAKRKLEDALAKDPDDEALKSKLDELNKKIKDLNSNTQPLLKFILGLVTLPIKVIAGIVEWIMNFFKSLTNPMMLPAKIIEFLSFKWIMDFFSPKGLLKLAGIDFDLTKVPQWMAMSKMPNPMKDMDPAEMAKAKAAGGGIKADAVAGAAGGAKDTAAKAKDAKAAAKDISPADAKAAAADKAGALKKDVPLHKAPYALPEDFELANLPEFLNIAFLAKLPTYSSSQMRMQGLNITKRLFLPIICFIEKLINGFIDFVWATLGIEAIIPPPHIKLCKSDEADAMDPAELNKILNGEEPGKGGTASSGPVDAKTDILATMPFTSQTPPLEKYVYEVKLQSGEVKRFLDRESLDEFMQENRDIGFDLQF